MRKFQYIAAIFLSNVALLANAQNSSGDSIMLQAKIWSRDANRNIQYSDWKTFGNKTMEQLKGFPKNKKADALDKFGGAAKPTAKATGYFYTTLQDGQWSVINPLGSPYISMAVTSVRPGQSPNNKAALQKNFGDKSKWIAGAKEVMDEAAFNSTGSWSEVESIRQYNKTARRPIVYTTQHNLLSSFTREKGRNSDEEKNAINMLAYVFDEGFAAYCDRRMAAEAVYKNDPNLFGHFSDNELNFQQDLLSLFLKIKNNQHPARLAAIDFIAKNNIDTGSITKTQKEMFSGFVADAYYSVVSGAVKKADPHHLYIGSRLHASAKNNIHVLHAAEKYCDILSINFYGNWVPTEPQLALWETLKKPYLITEFYTKAADTKMGNMSGAGWLVKTQKDRGIHYQNFCLRLLQTKNCVGWHWFRYQDNDPDDKSADPSNHDANKGIVNTEFEPYPELLNRMKALNQQAYSLRQYFMNEKK